MNLLKSRKNLLLYLFIGFSGFCLQIIVNKFLYNNINFPYKYSLLIGILCGTIWNFYFFNIFVFKKNKLKNKNLIKGLLKFLLSNFLSFILNFTIAFILYNNFKIYDIYSQVIAISCTVILNYFVYTRFIWKTNYHSR